MTQGGRGRLEPMEIQHNLHLNMSQCSVGKMNSEVSLS